MYKYFYCHRCATGRWAFSFPSLGTGGLFSFDRRLFVVYYSTRQGEAVNRSESSAHRADDPTNLIWVMPA